MFAVHVQRGSTGYHDFKIGPCGQKLCHGRRRLHQVLKIVQQEQHGRAR